MSLNPKTFVEVALPDAQWQAVADRASRLGLSTEDVVSIAVHEYLDRVEPSRVIPGVGMGVIR